MNPHFCQINLVLAWLGVVAGVLSGLGLGLKFHRENWLGGYGSFPRRMYRLAHISLFGLAILNLLFYFTAQQWSGGNTLLALASWAFAVGAVSMPVCCVMKVRFPESRALFALPVLSLLAGSAITVLQVIQP